MSEEAPRGTLYVVSTPIGNMGDFSFRVVEVLKEPVRRRVDDQQAAQRKAEVGDRARPEPRLLRLPRDPGEKRSLCSPRHDERGSAEEARKAEDRDSRGRRKRNL